MAGNSSGQDLNQAFLFYNQSNQVGSSSSQNDSLEELQPTTEVTWPLNGSQEAADPWSLVTASPLPVPDWLGLHKMLLEFSGLQLPPILVSPVLLVLAMAASELAYRLVLSHVLPGNVRSVLLDFLAAGEASLLSWEQLTLFHAYGLPVWTLFTYLTLVSKAYRYRADCVACPYSHLLSCLTGLLAWRHAALRICGQLAAGSAYFRLLTAVWDLGLSPIHVGRSYWMAYGRCASWLEVATWAGFLYECLGSLVCGLAAGLLYDVQLLPRLSLHVRVLTTSLVTLSAVLAAFYHTGGFFQPLLAYTRTFGCVGMLRDVQLMDHIVVYWVGSTAGAVAAMYLCPLVRRLLLKVSTCRRAAGFSVERLKEAEPLVQELEHQHTI